MSVLTLTEAAQAQLASAMQANGETTVYVGVADKGCGGHSYVMGYIDRAEVRASDSRLDLGGDRWLVVSEAHAPLLLGTVMDYQSTAFEGGFTFANPMAVSACGCGHSFSTSADPITSCSP